MNAKVDEYLGRVRQWREELDRLRSILLDCGLTEEYKWKAPCYTFTVDGKENNIAIIGGFKDHCVVSLLKGVLLNDSEGILEKPGENSQSARVIRFRGLQDIVDKSSTIKEYICEAIEVEKAGLKVEFKESTDLTYPEELEKKLNEDAKFKTAFEALTPGRKRAYNMFFTAAKQSATRETRIEKYRTRILDGKGMNDCTCGHSKRMPNCDGSHKYL